jgi:hypothetical protein
MAVFRRSRLLGLNAEADKGSRDGKQDLKANP